MFIDAAKNTMKISSLEEGITDDGFHYLFRMRRDASMFYLKNADMKEQMTKVTIPDDLSFSDLRLTRDPDGSVSFEWAVIERICQSSSLPIELFHDTPEDNVAGLIIGWYQAHIQRGGEPDPVAEDLVTEVIAEAKAGQAISHQPGRA